MLAGLLEAGIRHLFARRDYINRINIFPVPDGDTGTNMAFTFKAIMDALDHAEDERLTAVMEVMAEAALDGARGNSGAIMAQFLAGVREALVGEDWLTVPLLATAAARGAAQAWTAMAEPVAGTLPSVLDGFAGRLSQAAAAGESDLRRAFELGLAGARMALAATPEQLPVLQENGVVDAGGQGFVDLLEGIGSWLESGRLEPLDAAWQAEFAASPGAQLEAGEHRFCTECVICALPGHSGIDRFAVMDRLKQLEHSSMVVAGGGSRVRVHIHVNNPAEVFLACETFGQITQQKAEDMHRQHGLLNQRGTVAVVTDSGADLPAAEVDRLGIHVVPVRLSFGDREYLDGVSLQPREFYRLLAESPVRPRTSQPPAADFRRVFELLTSHGYAVLHVGLSEGLSGTTQAARSAASRVSQGQVEVLDSTTASCGQGLLVLAAAEAAAGGASLAEVQRLTGMLVPQVRTFTIPDELTSAVRGGRVPAWLGRLARTLRLMPVMTTRKGKIGIAGLQWGLGAKPATLARHALRAMRADLSYRVLVSHADNLAGAEALRRQVLEGHARIHSCHMAEAGPALGVHLGRGGLVIALLPELDEREIAGT